MAAILTQLWNISSLKSRKSIRDMKKPLRHILAWISMSEIKSTLSTPYFIIILGDRLPMVAAFISSICRGVDAPPVGAFTYRHLSPDRYSSGFIRVSLDDRRAFLIASPEKALIDTVFDRDIPSPDKLYQYLTDDLRIDDEELRKLDMKRLRELKRRFHTPTVDALVVISQELKS